MTRDNLPTQITSFKSRLLAPYNGLRVRWFETWDPILDDALQTLPEMDSCPHELFRLLIQNPGPFPKRTALITERGDPVAVVGLRQKGRYSWELVTQWIIPGAAFPSKPRFLLPAIEALGVEVWVAWWRLGNPPLQSPLLRYSEATPTYKWHFSDDFEMYWRENGYFKTIRRIRNRCNDFTLMMNPPGLAEWTIKNWEVKWRVNPAVPNPGLQDRIVAANYLEKQGRHHTVVLLDRDVPIGGATMTVHANDLVAGVLYYEPEYRRYGLGDRLIDLSFIFAAEKGYHTFDIGGGHEYKKHWARQEGERWWFNICPEPLFQVKQLAQWARQQKSKGNHRTEQEHQMTL